MNTRGALLGLSLLVAACGTPRTEIVAMVHSDLPINVMAGARIAIEHDDATAIFTQDCIELSTLSGWPSTVMSLGLVPDGESTQAFRVIAQGFMACGDAQPLVTRSALVEFVAGERLALPLELSAQCRMVVCPAGQTCDPATKACVSDNTPTLHDVNDDMAGTKPDLSTQPDGAVAPGGEMPLTSSVLEQAAPAIAWDGSDFQVAYLLRMGTTSASVLLQRVGPAGELKSPPVVVDDAAALVAPSIASDSSGHQLVLSAHPASTLWYTALKSGATIGGGTLSTVSQVGAVAYDAVLGLFRTFSYDGSNDVLSRVTSTTVTMEIAIPSLVAPTAAASTSNSQGTLEAWIDASGRMFTRVINSGDTATQGPINASAPLVVAKGMAAGFYVVHTGAAAALELLTLDSNGAILSNITTSIAKPDKLAFAGDGAGGTLLVLDTAGQISTTTVDQLKLGKLPTALFTDGFMRYSPAVEYSPTAGRYLIAYTRTGPAGLPAIWGVLY